MRELYAITVEYGHQVEQLLERLGATRPARGAGELLVQVEHRLSPEAVRAVQSFLRLRNRVIHNRPAWMSMPTREQIEQAGRKAVGALEYALGSRAYSGPAYRRMAATAPEAPGPVYRLVPRGEDYEFWVGPAGVWVVAAEARKRREVRLELEERLRPCFSRLRVRAVRDGQALERKACYGKAVMSADEVKEVVRLLIKPDPAPTRPSRSATARPEHHVRRVVLDDTPATFYVGPAGVLVVAEFPLIADTEAKRVWEDSGRAISALPVVLNPNLKEPQGRVGSVLALRDEGAIKEYLRGKRLLDDDEVKEVAGWLRNRTSPVPSIRPKGGRYRLRGEEVIGGREKAPPAFVVELVPPGAPPRPHFGQVVWRALGWRLVFLLEMVMFAGAGFSQPGGVGAAYIAFMGALVLRFMALFGSFSPWKFWTLLAVGGLELFLAWEMAKGPKQAFFAFLMLILATGLASFFRGIWLFWSSSKPFRMYFPLRSRVRQHFR